VTNQPGEKFIYLIRHGETDFNKKGYLQGSSIDASLNEKGRIQAEHFYHKYKNVSFDKIYTSVLKRSIESVQMFINQGIPHESFAELNEINWGEMEGKLLTPAAWIKLRRIARRWGQGYTNEKIRMGESPEDVARRQRKVLELILSRQSERNILICMHGRALRIFICLLMNLPISEMDKFPHSNLGLYLMKYDYQLKKAEILIRNEHHHEKSS